METDYLSHFRKQVDIIDNEILILLKRRSQISKKIAKLKIEKNMSLFDDEREIEMYKNITEKSSKMQLSQSFVRKLFQEIIENSKQESLRFKEDSKK